MKKLQIGLQFWPWYPVRTTVSYAEIALNHHPYDQIWLCDEYQYTDPFTVLAIIAEKLKVSVGTLVTFVSRNPLYLAQKFASISELLPDGKEITAGFGPGGVVQRQVMLGHPASVEMTSEAVRLLRRLFNGEVVELAEFPRLAQRFGFNAEGKAKLYFPPQKKVRVCVAAGGRKMLEVAGKEADGLVCTLIHPRSSLVAMRMGMFQEAMSVVDAAVGQRPVPENQFHRIFNLHVSVSKDRRAAIDLAKRQVSYGVGTYLPVESHRKDFERQGISIEALRQSKVREAYIQALGMEEAAERVDDDILKMTGFVVAGTADECTEKCLEITSHLRKANFDQVVLGVPLGPDVPEALELMGREIAPAIAAS
jgi:alkanesulfonate monooxygenase SsuD/methylene tetrahydromethanopterin reductase-like flavin-dependent oxidoreductase (luciferase family)